MAFRRPVVLVDGLLQQLQPTDTLDASAVISGPVGATGPTGAIGPTGPPGLTFYRLFAGGFGLSSPDTVLLNGMLAVFSVVFGGDSLEVITGAGEDLTQLSTYLQPSELVCQMASLLGLTNLTDLDLHNNVLTTPVVNQIITDLKNNNASNGTLRLDGQIRPAAPTGQGLIDLATLRSRGWTCSVDASNNLSSAQVNSVLANYVTILNSGQIQAVQTISLGGNTPPAPPTGVGITDLCLLRATQNPTGSNPITWVVTVDPFVGLTSGDLDTLLTMLLSSGIYCSSIDFSHQSPPCTPSSPAVANLAILANMGWSIQTDPIGSRTASQIEDTLTTAVASYYQGNQWPTYTNVVLNIAQSPPINLTNTSIASMAILRAKYWTITANSYPTLSSGDVEGILTAIYTSYVQNWSSTPVPVVLTNTPPATPTDNSIGYAALLNTRGFAVTLDPIGTLVAADIDAILGLIQSSYTNGYGQTLTLTGPTPSNETIALQGMLQGFGWTIVLSPRANLSVADVNEILADAVALGAQGPYYLDLSGQSPPAPPTDTTDLAQLTTWGWTVITD